MPTFYEMQIKLLQVISCCPFGRTLEHFSEGADGILKYTGDKAVSGAEDYFLLRCLLFTREAGTGIKSPECLREIVPYQGRQSIVPDDEQLQSRKTY